VRLLPAGFRGIEVKANTPAAQWRIGGYDFFRAGFSGLDCLCRTVFRYFLSNALFGFFLSTP
jgi:hypothetical protein